MKLLLLLFVVICGGLNFIPVWAKSELEAEAQTWSRTELTPIWVTSSFDQNYCKKSPDFFRGCFAGLDSLAQQVNPLYRLVLESDVRGRPVIFSTATLRVIQVAVPILRVFPEQEREFWKVERIRYQAVQHLIPGEVAPEIQELSNLLLSQREDLKPYEVARIFNAVNMYVYDPQSFYAPTFRFNATPVPIPRPETGLVLSKSSKGWIVRQVLRPSSAYENGIKRGDLLEKVDGQPVSSLDADSLLDLLSLPEKQKVRVTLSREGRSSNFDLITAFNRNQEYILKTLTMNGQKFGYLGLETTHNTAVEVYCNHVAKELIAFEKEVRGLILDLRGHSMTGSAEFASCISGFFLGSKQPIFTAKSLYDPNQLFRGTTSTKKVFWKPLVILQDEETEGAIELISGSLQQLGRALIIGETSKGNGTESVVTTFARLDRFETAFVQYLPSGESHHNVGVTPNIRIFRSEKPNYFESTSLRFSEIGVAQVEPGKITALKTALDAKAYPLSEDCLRRQNVKSQYLALAPTSPEKDLQLLTGLNALYCTTAVSF